jgi:hypothetical protein
LTEACRGQDEHSGKEIKKGCLYIIRRGRAELVILVWGMRRPDKGINKSTDSYAFFVSCSYGETATIEKHPKSINTMSKIMLSVVALSLLPLAAFSQKVDYSVVSVPEETGIDFQPVTTSNDYVCMPQVKHCISYPFML